MEPPLEGLTSELPKIARHCPAMKAEVLCTLRLPAAAKTVILPNPVEHLVDVSVALSLAHFIEMSPSADHSINLLFRDASLKSMNIIGRLLFTWCD